MAHAWLNPEERETVIRSLIAGNDWATTVALVPAVDDTFIDTQETLLTAVATQRKAESREGIAALEDAYRHDATPTFTSITNRLTGAATGDAGGGEHALIVGTLFNDPAVTIGGHAETVETWNLTQIVIKTAAHAAEAAQHLIITNHGTKSVEAADAWATVAAVTPTYTSITPTTGSILGGADCRIVGTNFREGVTVAFGGTAALVTSVSTTVIQCVAPAHAAGAVNVVITNLSTTTVTGTGVFTYA